MFELIFAALFIGYNFLTYCVWESTVTWAAAGNWDQIIRLSPLILVFTITDVIYWRLAFAYVKSYRSK